MADARRRVVNIGGDRLPGDDLENPVIFYCRSGHALYSRAVAPNPKDPDVVQTRIIQFSPITVIADNSSLANAGMVRLFNSSDVKYLEEMIRIEKASGAEPQLLTPEMYTREMQLSMVNDKETGRAGMKALLDEKDQLAQDNIRLQQLVEQLQSQQGTGGGGGKSAR